VVTRRRPARRALGWYVGGITVAGSAVLATVVATTSPAEITGPAPLAFWLFVLCVLATEVRPITWLHRHHRGDVTLSWVFGFSLLLIAPPAGALLSMAVASLLGDRIHEKSWGRALFNAAQVTLSLGMASLILDAYPQHQVLLGTHPPTVDWLVVAVLAAAAAFVLNHAFVAVILALQATNGAWPIIRRGLTVNLATDGMLVALAPIFVVVARESVVLLPLLLVAAWAVYRSARDALTQEHHATHDPLTGLPNRRHFLEAAAASLERARARRHRVAVVALDLDGFKAINDRFGHRVGDIVLEAVAGRLTAAKRGADFVGRLGGDEFGLLLNRVDSATAAAEIAERLIRELERPCVVHGFPLTVRGSFGISLFPDHGDSVETLFNHADVAMYGAKRKRTAGVRVYSHHPDHNQHDRLGFLAQLRRAIDDDRLYLEYQPTVHLASGRVVGAEALVRWNHPHLGEIRPDDFVPLAEQTQLMAPLTEYVLRRAAVACAGWHRQGHDLTIAVNGSARNLHDPRFPRIVDRALDDAGLHPRWLELEVTENTVMADPARAIEVITELRALGVTLAIDDFGTGFSSLAYLRAMAVDHLKIDKSFVAGLNTNPGDEIIVRSIIDLAHNLGLESVAEGVEDTATWRTLADLGCDLAQGHLVSRALAPEQLTAWLRTWERRGALEVAVSAS
jgi:diguanylate cyclase (GGDEF)-like protein